MPGIRRAAHGSSWVSGSDVWRFRGRSLHILSETGHTILPIVEITDKAAERKSLPPQPPGPTLNFLWCWSGSRSGRGVHVAARCAQNEGNASPLSTREPFGEAVGMAFRRLSGCSSRPMGRRCHQGKAPARAFELFAVDIQSLTIGMCVAYRHRPRITRRTFYTGGWDERLASR